MAASGGKWPASLAGRVAGEAKPAALMTKYLSLKDVHQHWKSLNLRWISRNRITDPAEGGCRDEAPFQNVEPQCIGELDLVCKGAVGRE